MIPFLRRKPKEISQPFSHNLTHSDTSMKRFAAGVSRLVDLIAPGQIVHAFDHIILDNRYVRVLMVTDWPRYITLGWLEPLLALETTMDISLYIEPIDTHEIQEQLRQKLVALEASFISDEKTGRVTEAHAKIQYEDIQRLQMDLASREELVYSARLFIMLHANSLQELNDLQSKVSDALAACGIGGLKARPLYLEQRAGFHSVLPEGRWWLLDKPYRNVPSSAAAAFMPFSSGSFSHLTGVYYGDSRQSSGSMVVVDRFRLDNANSVVLGASGKGKSYFVKMEAVQLLCSGCEYFIIDPENEYGDLARALNGQYVQIAATSRQHINPFDLSIGPQQDNDDDIKDPLTEKVMYLTGLIELMTSTINENGPPIKTITDAERDVLDQALYDVYRMKRITRDILTHRNPPPVLADLFQHLWEMGDGTPGRSLARKLQRFVQGSMAEVFNSPTDVDLHRPLVVFDINSLEPALRPLAMSILTDFIWQQVRTNRRQRILLIDEVWQLLRHQASAEFVQGLVKRARKYALGITSITQNVEDFVLKPQGRPIVTNAELVFLMGQRLGEVRALADVFDLSERECQLLQSAGRGEGLLLVGQQHLYIKVPRQPEYVHQLITTDYKEKPGGYHERGR
jgi:conjugal transfer ATP-binding protein TraC